MPAAKAIGVSRQHIHEVLAGRRALTPEMALRLEAFIGGSAEVWVRLQGAYDLHHAGAKLADELKRIPRHAA